MKEEDKEEQGRARKEMKNTYCLKAQKADTIGEFPLEPLLYVGKDQVNIDVFHTSRIR